MITPTNARPQVLNPYGTLSGFRGARALEEQEDDEEEARKIYRELTAQHDARLFWYTLLRYW